MQSEKKKTQNEKTQISPNSYNSFYLTFANKKMRATITSTPITARELLTPTQWTDLQARNTSNGKNVSVVIFPE